MSNISETLPPIYKYKYADQSVTSNTSLQDDTELSVPLEANKTYNIQIIGGVNYANNTMGYNVGLSAPSSPTSFYARGELFLADGSHAASKTFSLAPNGYTTSGSLTYGGDYVLTVFGTITVGSTPGNLVFQFAQNTSDAGAVTVKQGTVLEVIQTN